MERRLERKMAELAETITKSQVNSACFFVLYQQKMPESIRRKYKKR